MAEENIVYTTNVNDDKQMPLISIVILNYNGKGYVEDCLRSIFNSNYTNFEVIIIDNASSDNSVETIKKEFSDRYKHQLKIIQNKKNLFYAEGNNIGARNSNGKYIIFLNNDTEVDPNWLIEICKIMNNNNDIGAAQPKILYYADKMRIDNVGGILDIFGYPKGRGQLEFDNGQFDNMQEIFFAGGTAMIVRKSILDKVGIFDPKFFAYSEDVDLSWRIRLCGYKIIVIPKSKIYHKTSMTVKKINWKNQLLFHIRKNRLAILIKNYSLLPLLIIFPCVTIFYFSTFLKEIIFDRNFSKAITSIKAIWWNIREIRYLLNQRQNIQNKIRKVPDYNIVKYMSKKPVVFYI